MSRRLILYIDKTPPLENFQPFRALTRSDLAQIMASGNHWRKIINIYAKLAFGLNSKNAPSWQDYRDHHLLSDTESELLLSQRNLLEDEAAIHLICGKRQFESMNLNQNLFSSLDERGRIHTQDKVIQTPYFDYRQFPNKLIEELVEAIKEAYD